MEANEVFRLALAVSLAPVVVGLGMRIRLPAVAWPFTATYFSIVAAYLSAVIEDSWLPTVFHTLQHVFYAVAGIALLVAAVRLRALAKEASWTSS